MTDISKIQLTVVAEQQISLMMTNGQMILGNAQAPGSALPTSHMDIHLQKGMNMRSELIIKSSTDVVLSSPENMNWDDWML